MPLLNPQASSRDRSRVYQRPVSYVVFSDRVLGDADPDKCSVVRVGDDAMMAAGVPRGSLVVAEKVRVTRIRRPTLMAVLFDDLPAVRYLHYGAGRINIQGFRSMKSISFERDSDEVFVVGRACAVAQLF